MTKIKMSLLTAAVVTGVAVPWAVQHQALSRLRQENRALSQQANQAAAFAAENTRLADDLAQANRAHARDQEQLAELVRLRGEVGGLRTAKRELDRLLAERAAAPQSAGAPARTGAEKPEKIPREKWSFAGYATPEAALESVFWAMKQGDYATLRASFTPELQTAMDSEMQRTGKSRTEMIREMNADTQGLQELPLANRISSSAEEVTFVVTLKESQTADTRAIAETLLTLTNAGGEWKLTKTSGKSRIESLTPEGP